MKKLVYPVMLALFFMFLIGCENIEIKKISTVKCKSCGKIMEADTVTIVGQLNKRLHVFTTSEGKIYNVDKSGMIIKNEKGLCSDCLEKKKKELFVKGKRYYRNGDYLRALDCFRKGGTAEALGNKEVNSWIQKAKKKRSEVLIVEGRKKYRSDPYNYGNYGLYDFQEAERLGNKKASYWIKKAEKKIIAEEKGMKEKELQEKKRREREEIAREKKQELADRFVECGIRFAIISDVYREMNYNLKYRTLSSQIQLKARELEKYAEDVYLPAANEFSYYLSKYGEKYGILAARDLAIQHGFIHVFK